MANMIKIKRGLKTNLPILERGELGYATDTNELFIGVELEPSLISDNVLVNDLSDLENYFTQSQIASMGGFGLLWDTENEKFYVDFASNQEALDPDNDIKVMNPKRTDEVITSRLNSRLISEQYASETFVNNKINALPGTGLTLTEGTLEIVNPFNPNGDYTNLRARSTTKEDVGLEEVTNESKATMFTDPTFTGTVSGVTATMVGLGNVTNESKATMFTDPTFTGTVSGVTAEMVGLGNVTNESKATMFSSPTFTGTVTGVTAAMVGLGNVTNESKATMFTDPTFTGTVTLASGGALTGIPIPSGNEDAANKAYVDQVAQGVKSRTQAAVLITFNLPGTYNSIPTLHEFTSSTNGAFPTVDGVDSSLLNVEGVRFVLSAQSNPAHNGLYVLKTIGDASNPWVIRRCTECSTSEQIPGSYVFITKGDQYENTGWIFDVENPITFVIGQDDINVIQFSGVGTFIAGTGLTLDGNEFSLKDNYGDTKNPYASKTSKHFLAAPNATNGAPTFRAIVASDIPALNQNTTGTASNVTGTVAIANGGTGATTAANARTNLGATTAGSNLLTLTNPSAVTFLRINANNTVSTLSAADFRTAIGAGTSSTTGTVTSVGGTGTVSGLTLSGTVTTSGNITLGGTLSVTGANFGSQSANTVLAGPNGSAGNPTFRTLVAADIPSLDTSKLGSGILALARGGTNRSDGRSTGVIETRNSDSIQFWTGTQAQYDAIGTKNANTLYFIQE